jgi:nitroimidazol reductase NimA-like FMN-containing flavoprotein (pyridoxamine 5'-phosphate oxidase superfamily)
MGRGKAEFVEDVAEKQLALSAIMKAQTGKDFTFEPKMTTIVTIVKITASEYTAKHRPLPEKMR